MNSIINWLLQRIHTIADSTNGCNHWPPQDHAIERHQSPTRRPALGQYIRQPDIANRGLSVSQSVSRPPVTSLQVLYLYPLFCRSSSTNTTSCYFQIDSSTFFRLTSLQPLQRFIKLIFYCRLKGNYYLLHNGVK